MFEMPQQEWSKEEKKKLTWLCVNLTKHVIYFRLELELCIRCTCHKTGTGYIFYYSKEIQDILTAT